MKEEYIKLHHALNDEKSKWKTIIGDCDDILAILGGITESKPSKRRTGIILLSLTFMN